MDREAGGLELVTQALHLTIGLFSGDQALDPGFRTMDLPWLFGLQTGHGIN
jgi:hypothetical protein